MNYICVYLSLFVLAFSTMCSTGKGRGPNLPFNNVPRRNVSSGAVPLRGFLRPSLGPRHNHHLSLGHQTEVESFFRRRTRPILLETNRHEPPQRPRKSHGHLYPSRRISNGDVAEVGQFPWQVALSIDRHTACGASLISEEWVLTAAHCIYNKSNVTLLIGSRNRQREDEGSLEMTSGEFIVHPKYSQGTNYDLGLIKLPRAVVLSDNIKPVDLPKMSQENETFVDSVATVSGWGRTTRRSELLYHVNVTVVPNKICTQGKNQQGICSVHTPYHLHMHKDKDVPPVFYNQLSSVTSRLLLPSSIWGIAEVLWLSEMASSTCRLVSSRSGRGVGLTLQTVTRASRPFSSG